MEDKYRFFPLDVFLEKQEDCSLRYLEEADYSGIESRMLAHLQDTFISSSLDELAVTFAGQYKDTKVFTLLVRDKHEGVFPHEPGTEKLKNNPWYRRGKSGKKLRY